MVSYHVTINTTGIEVNSLRISFHLADIVFCRTWCNVDVPQFYNPVTSLLLPPEKKMSWSGMKTSGQLKREKGIKSEPQIDSLYKVSTLVSYCSIILSQFYRKCINVNRGLILITACDT